MEHNENIDIDNNNTNIAINKETEQMIKIINFMCMFMCETLAKRIVSMILILAGIPNARVTELTKLCDRSVRSLRKDLKTKEIESLFVVKGGGQKSKVKDVETEIVDEIEKNNYTNRQQIADMIFEKFGIKTSVWAVGRLLKKNKIRGLKSGSLPAKADAEKQREFCDNTLYQLMEKAKSGIINLQFMDGSHFVMGCDFLGRIYGKTRRFVKTLSGRMRYNVLGALDYVTKEVTMVSNDDYLNGGSVCDLLRKLSMKNISQAMYVILDNARYQKCKIVQELADQLGIILVYIPPYSPNLNLIERLWGFVKRNLRTKYYDNFDEFKERIDSLINSTDKENKKIIDQLIGKKIQLFDDLVPVNENTFVKSKTNGTLVA